MAAIGDVLYLKSGSQPMTVLQQTEAGGLLLTWFAGSMPQRAEFPEICLVSDDPAPALNDARNKIVAAIAAADAKVA